MLTKKRKLKVFLVDFSENKKNSYSTDLRYEYDFTDSDNFSYYKPVDNPKPTRNFRIGLELELQYHFSLGICNYCDNQNH